MATETEIPIYGVRNRVDRTGPAIINALRPERRPEFEGELRAALAESAQDLDVGRIEKVIDRWWPEALLAANPEIQAQINDDRRRIAEGDPTVIVETVLPAGHPLAPKPAA